MKTPESIWQEINLIGRSKLIKKLQTFINQRKRFVLKGVRGVGKSAVLEFCHELAKGKISETGSRSALIDAKSTYGTILKTIAADWELEVEPSKGKGNPTQADLETAILQEEDHYIFCDNLNSATGQKVYLLKILAERHVVNGVMLSGVKSSEELRQFLWFVRNEVTIPKLPKTYSEQMARKACVYLGSKASIEQVAAHAKGLPGRIVAFATAGEVGRDAVTLQSEEIDVSWVLLILGGGIMIFRYLGRSIGATDFVLLGGAGLIFALFLRLIIQQGKEKK